MLEEGESLVYQIEFGSKKGAIEKKGQCEISNGLFTGTVSVKFYLCINGDEPFDGQHRSGTHSLRQRKFNGDADGNGTCIRTLRCGA